MIEHLVCPKCFSAKVKLKITNKVGFKSQLIFECENCTSNNLFSASSSALISAEFGYDINQRVTKAFKTISKGHAVIEQFTLIMNMNYMNKASHSKYSAQLHKLTKMSRIEFCQKQELEYGNIVYKKIMS